MASAKIQYLKVTKLVANLDRNPRLASSYDESKDKQFKDLKNDIALNGFRIDKPVVVSRRKTANGIEDVVIQGHRRREAAFQINQKDASKCAEIPCLVFEGLSEADEVKYMIDHFLVKDLGDFEQYLAVKRLVFAGLSEEAIASQIGKSRGFVQRRKWIANAPTCVEDAWRAKAEGGEATVAITDKNLTELTKAKNADREDGTDDPEGGPKFKEAWTALCATGKVVPTEPKSRTRKDLLDLCNTFKDPIIVTVLKFAAGDSGGMAELVEEIKVLRAKAAQLDKLMEDERGEKKVG